MASSGFVEVIFGSAVEHNVKRQAVGHRFGASRDACDFNIPSQRHFVEQDVFGAGHDAVGPFLRGHGSSLRLSLSNRTLPKRRRRSLSRSRIVSDGARKRAKPKRGGSSTGPRSFCPFVIFRSLVSESRTCSSSFFIHFL